MRDYDIHQAQQMGELPGGGLLAQFWRNLARVASLSFGGFKPGVVKPRRRASAR